MAKKSKVTENSETVVHSIKGFNSDFTCRGVKFEVGKTYELDKGTLIKHCQAGYHACDGEAHPFDVFKYYPPANSRYATVIQSGELSRSPSDSKIASAKIMIEAEIQMPELIQRAVKWVFDRAKWSEGPIATKNNEGATASGIQGAATASGDRGAATASGYQGAATASGTRGAATASGDQGAATASGTQGAATASGTRGAATASGYRGAATASGDQGAATASGYRGRARAAEGSALFLVYRPDWGGLIEHVWAGIAGRDGIKPNTWYWLNSDGKPEEIEVYS